jgi:hypothetical protein
MNAPENIEDVAPTPAICSISDAHPEELDMFKFDGVNVTAIRIDRLVAF